ncbi:MAG: hypothetical protein KF735_02280 [Chelatococcus sp.]|uniref:hypothetical protein n=1 Tax=Chelatococcus sp. TaxID=1953771 RepID=UPI0025C2FFC1|nr:hypothetical protein [Chelatococcus sp.]MBX3536440.1 hypothetical protein [Chelatococcus sp.]
MTTAAEFIADLREQIDDVGESVTLTRGAQSTTVKAWVVGFEPRELVGDIRQGDRKVIMPAEPFAKGAVPAPAGDALLIVGGKPMKIIAVNDSTRRIGGVLIAYEIVARGHGAA